MNKQLLGGSDQRDGEDFESVVIVSNTCLERTLSLALALAGPVSDAGNWELAVKREKVEGRSNVGAVLGWTKLATPNG